MPERPRPQPILHDAASVCLTWLGRLAVAAVVAPMAGLVAFLVFRGVPGLGASLFFGDTPAWQAVSGCMPVWDGIWPACAGTLRLVALAVGLALLPGIGTGIYLAEFAAGGKRRLLDAAVDMLAAVPSVVMGLFGFTLILFLRRTLLPDATTCLFLAALCLAQLVMPSLIVATREALEAMPQSLRAASAAMGLSRAQAVRHVLLPAALPGITGGVVLAVGRAAEDTAVIMLTGAVANAGLSGGLGETFEAIPFFIYYTAAQHVDEAELGRAFSAALVLLALSACLFAATNVLRERFLRRWRGTHREME